MGQIFRISAKSIVLLALGVASSWGQEKANGTGPVYRVGVDRKLAAVSYPYGSAPTKIDFTGTALLPEAKGVAIVRSGHTEIDANFERLPPPMHFGWQYPTYVLWAVTPEGACQNLGELVLQESNRARLQATTDLQTFALMVTAEPYSIVRQPSSMVVLENQVRPDMAAKVVAVEANPALKSGTEYTWEMGPPPADSAKASETLDRASRELHEAVNAVTIARLAGGDRFAPEPLASAQRALTEATDLYNAKGDPKLVIQNAREAVQRGDGARTIAERRHQEPGAGRSREDAAGAGSHGAPSGEALEPLSRSLLHEVVDGTFPAQDTERGLVITLPDTDFDGAALLHSIVQKLAPVASTLTTQPNLHIDVEGYMDSAELASWDRAESVRSALLKAGLQGNQISMRGGMTKPARPGEDRRVQIVISGAPAAPNAPPPNAASVTPPVGETVPAVAANPEPTRVASPATANPQPSEVAAVQLPPVPPSAPATPPSEPAAAPVAPVTPPPPPAESPVVQPTPPPAASLAPAPAISPESPIPALPVVAKSQAPASATDIAAAKAATSHQAQGRKFLQEERYDDAIREFTEALTLNPSLALAYNGRGYAYYRLKNYQAAAGDFDIAIRLNPDYANAYVNRSACRRAMGDKAGAATDAAKARDLTATTTARSAVSGSSPGL